MYLSEDWHDIPGAFTDWRKESPVHRINRDDATSVAMLMYTMAPLLLAPLDSKSDVTVLGGLHAEPGWLVAGINKIPKDFRDRIIAAEDDGEIRTIWDEYISGIMNSMK